MTDIIANAKRLLDGATPGPWKWEERSCKGDFRCSHDWLGSEHGTALETTDSDEYSSWVESSDLDKALIAAAPELAQALAEETWEYSFQIKYADGWETASNSVTEIDEWWPDKSDAEQAANSAYDPYIERPMRLVRRRVSPVEVISD